MKRRIQQVASLFCLLSLGTSTGWAQEPLIYQPHEMQADLTKFAAALIDLHPGTFTHQSRGEFDRLIDILKSETSAPLEAVAFYRRILRLVAAIHDGHTQAYAFGALGDVISAQRRLPLGVHVQDERIFIARNLSSRDITPGSEVLAIDGRLSSEILSGILQHYSSDGVSSQGMYHWLGGPYRPFNRIYPEVFGDQPSYRLSYRDRETRKVATVELKAIPTETYDHREARRYPAPDESELALSCSVNAAERYAYLRIGRFFKDSFDEPEDTFPLFYRTCFEEITVKRVDHLIVDLRDNGGGKASNAAYLLQYFIKEPLVPAKEISTLGNDAYYLGRAGAKLDLDVAFGLAPTDDGRFRVTRTDVLRDLMTYRPIETHGYSGRLFVLINGGTTSAAAVAAGLLQEHTRATLVGEETFGYAGISNGVRNVSVRGDHTETAIHLPLLHAEYDAAEEVQRRSAVPDHRVSPSVKDVLERNDAVLAFVLEELIAPITEEPEQARSDDSVVPESL